MKLGRMGHCGETVGQIQEDFSYFLFPNFPGNNVWILMQKAGIFKGHLSISNLVQLDFLIQRRLSGLGGGMGSTECHSSSILIQSWRNFSLTGWAWFKCLARSVGVEVRGNPPPHIIYSSISDHVSIHEFHIIHNFTT